MLQALGHSLTKGNAFGTVFGFYLFQMTADFRDGVRPGNSHPFAVSPVPGSLQRIFEARGVIETICRRECLGADITAVQIPVRISFDFDNAVALYAHL